MWVLTQLQTRKVKVTVTYMLGITGIQCEKQKEVVLCINLQLKREPGSSQMICMRMEEYSFVSTESTVDYVRVDAVNDHFKSKKHCSGKETKVGKAERSMGGSAAGSSQQITLFTQVKSKDAHQEFILDYVKLCTLADIPQEKTEKIRPF